MTERRQRAVPKFASFRPPPPPAKEAHETRPGSNGEASHRERDAVEESGKGREPRPDDPFIIDKYGDPLILQFGSNDRSKVPVYRRFGAGRIIGSRGFLVIDRDATNEPFTIRGPGDSYASPSAFRDKALIAATSRVVARHVKPDPNQPPPAETDAFIPLAPSRKRKRHDDSSDEDDDHLPDYRSIHSKAKPSDFRSSSSDSESDSDSDSQPAIITITETKSRALTLSSHLKSHPTDLPAWLDLISLQDRLFAENRPGFASTTSSVQPLAADERLALAELKMSLYRDALTAAANAPSLSADKDGCRERLLLGMMREARVLWDEARVAGEWEEVMKRYSSPPSSAGGRSGDATAGFALWRGRVDFEMRRAGGFQLERVRDLLVRKLAELGRGLAVYVFLRATRLLWDAGFKERAVAAWQAMLELTFCRPPELTSAEPALAAFADFWESEVPRLGEDGARGWRAFVEAGGTGTADVPDPGCFAGGVREPSKPAATNPFEAWADAEEAAAAKAWMPARMMDEDAEDDPFRVVLVDDIKDLLVWFPAGALCVVKPMLVDAFVVFCGLSPAGLSDDRFARLLVDPFVAHHTQGLDQGLKADSGTAPEVSAREPEFGGHGGCMAISPDVLFAGRTWFQYLGNRSSPPEGRERDMSWVLQTALGYLVRECGMESAAEYYLALEWVKAPAQARKVAKGLLKQYSSNVRLYNAYALVEWVKGNVEVSHKVLSSATSLPCPPAERQLLWNTWAWIGLEAGQKDAALSRLCMSVDNDDKENAGATGVSPVLLLKARTQLATARDYSLSSQQLEAAVRYAESAMLLEYLSPEAGDEHPASAMQGNITAALASVDRFSKDLESRGFSGSLHHERFLQAAARLIYYHATHGPYQPSHLQSHLTTFARLFPRNAIFPTLLRFWSSGPAARLNDPVRALFQEQLQQHHPIQNQPPTQRRLTIKDRFATRVLAILHELHAGTAHSVRTAFEAALRSHDDNDEDGMSSAAAASPELWASYLRFMCRQQQQKPHNRPRAAEATTATKQLRDLFYRAVGACPWSKEVHMLALAEPALRAVLSETELRAVGESIVARGLRVHVEVGEFVERWEREKEEEERKRKGEAEGKRKEEQDRMRGRGWR
ncbi:hypothetical protein VTJ49DRAFT_3741 [Mycothermus thermophilus]|uniref:DUF1740-domain-containing protein n=1 Tax=Humicola insolens TaxID=85995 RepID=A0ABR3V6U1_HUMIN